jgi:hypothetical protein
MRLIETTHLKTWAGSKSAESRFPHIVKALISAVIQPEKLRMPSGDAVWVPGYDGVVVNSEKNRFVPIGLSVWEVGTDANIKRKADRDYGKRSKDKAEDSKELLPDTHSVSMGTVKPRWRDIGDLPEDARTKQGQSRYLSAIIDRALDHLGIDPERWRAILNSLHVLSPIQQEKVINLLDVIARGATSEDIKTTFWEMLRDFIYRHRAFQDANWALKGELIDRIETILPHLAPNNPAERNRWLFDDWLPDLPLRKKKHQAARARS